MNLLERFFAERDFKNKSESVQADYRIVLERFLDQFGHDLSKLGTQELLSYLGSERFNYYTRMSQGEAVREKYAHSTIEKNTGIIRSFLGLLYDLELIEVDYASQIERVEQKRVIGSKSIDNLPEVEEIALLENWLQERFQRLGDYFSLRDLVVFNLAFHSGMSSAELSSVDALEPELYGNSLVITAEEPSRHSVKINRTDARQINLLIKKREQIEARDNALFVGEKRKTRLPRRSISYLINQACLGAGIKTYSARDLGKAGILAAVSVGYGVEDLARDLGVGEAYLKRRLDYAGKSSKVKSYTDLFEK